jgi:hypothetical protein
VLNLVGGIVRHIEFANDLRRNRQNMIHESLLRGKSPFPVSITLLTALALLLVGVVAAVSIVFHLPLFG